MSVMLILKKGYTFVDVNTGKVEEGDFKIAIDDPRVIGQRHKFMTEQQAAKKITTRIQKPYQDRMMRGQDDR